MKTQTLQPRKNPSLPKVNCRFVQIEPEHIRTIAPTKAGGPFTFSGYAVKWASVNSYGEQFMKGAFSDLIAAVESGAKKVHMYYNHGWRNGYFSPQMAMRIGRWTKFTEDDVGLLVEGALTEGLSLANDVQAMLADGTVDGLSIAFYPPAPMDVKVLSDREQIYRADIYEISPCDEPSDNDARLNQEGDEGDDPEADDGSRSKQMAAALSEAGVSDDTAAKFLARFSKLTEPQKNGSHDPFSFLDDVKTS